MLLESIHKRRLVVYINLDQGFKIVSRCDINSAFIFKWKFLHSFFWNGVNLANQRTVSPDYSVVRISGASIWWCGAFYGMVSWFGTVETEVKLNAMFLFFWGKSSTTPSVTSSASKTSVTLGSSIDFWIFSGNFLNACIIPRVLESSHRSHKGMPILIEFPHFLY